MGAGISHNHRTGGRRALRAQRSPYKAEVAGSSPAAPILMRRVVVTALAVVAGFLAVAPAASAHAGLLSSSPADRAELPEAPTRVILGFSERVELLRPSDVTVVDEDGRPVTTGGAKTSPRDASIVEVPVRPGLPPASYTVRYRIVSADSHIVDGDTTFATRGAALKE